MKMLINLKVKYGFPISAVLGFLVNKDKEEWTNFLKDFYYEISVCHEQGQIYLLIRDCCDEQKITKGITSLPLVKEGFLEMNIHQFDKFQSLDNFFTLDQAPRGILAV